MKTTLPETAIKTVVKIENILTESKKLIESGNQKDGVDALVAARGMLYALENRKYKSEV